MSSTVPGSGTAAGAASDEPDTINRTGEQLKHSNPYPGFGPAGPASSAVTPPASVSGAAKASRRSRRLPLLAQFAVLQKMKLSSVPAKSKKLPEIALE